MTADSKAKVKDTTQSGPAELETRIMQEVDRFTGVGPQQDDITVVVAQVRAPALRSVSSHGPRAAR